LKPSGRFQDVILKMKFARRFVIISRSIVGKGWWESQGKKGK